MPSGRAVAFRTPALQRLAREVPPRAQIRFAEDRILDGRFIRAGSARRAAASASLRQRCSVLALTFQRSANSVSVKAGSVNMALLSSFVLGITAAKCDESQVAGPEAPCIGDGCECQSTYLNFRSWPCLRKPLWAAQCTASPAQLQDHRPPACATLNGCCRNDARLKRLGKIQRAPLGTLGRAPTPALYGEAQRAGSGSVAARDAGEAAHLSEQPHRFAAAAAPFRFTRLSVIGRGGRAERLLISITMGPMIDPFTALQTHASLEIRHPLQTDTTLENVGKDS